MSRKKRRTGKVESPVVLLEGFNSVEIRCLLKHAREWCWELHGTWDPANPWNRDRRPAGAIIKSSYRELLAVHLRRIDCPAVRLGRLPDPSDDILPAVLPDLALSGRMAAEHFSVRKFRQVAFVGYDPEDPDANMHAAFAAFRERAGELGMHCRLFRLAGCTRRNATDREQARTVALSNWLRDLPKPVGVFCFNDIMAERILALCLEMELAVPEDVALLGHGNAVQCEIASVRLSSIDPGLDAQVESAAMLLRRLMHGEPAPTEPVMVPPAGIVERRSTNVLAVGNPVVARALRFLWDNFERDLSVPDVAAHVGVNRRMLERAFREELGSTVREELRRRRLNAACEMLRDSDDSIAEIAARVGYRSTQYLHRAFLAAYGVTPRGYRLSKCSQ